MLGDGARDAKGRPRLVLDLARLDLGGEGDETFDALSPFLLERIWWVVDECFAIHGSAAARRGVVLQIDARKAAPARHLRPKRLAALIKGVTGLLPARLAAVEVIGAPAWLAPSWTALGPVVSPKTAARASKFTVAAARERLGDAATRHFRDDVDAATAALEELEAGDGEVEGVFVQAAAAPPPPPPPPLQTPAGTSRERVDAIVAELGASRVPEDPDVLSWTEDAVFMYYATDGAVKPSATPDPIARLNNKRRSSYQRVYYNSA